jgi:PPOX class probable FMN-dependent enzyme
VTDDFLIRTEADIDAVIGPQIEKVKEKVYTSFDESMLDFIKRSPFVLLSTIDSNGQIDVSPKGDSPGFVHVDETGGLLIPDRPGNRLTFGFRNILGNNNVGLIFLVPNLRETLRVKGTAKISRDPEILQKLSERGKPALLCTHVEISQCFFHCGKALIRSKMWRHESWLEQKESLMLRSIAQRYDADDDAKREIETEIEDSYQDDLY